VKAFITVAVLLLAVTSTVAQDVEGEISGVVVDARGLAVADQRVELLGPDTDGRNRLIATTDSNGRFAFSRLGPGRYQVEVRVEDRVIARSSAIELTDGAMRVSGVSLTRLNPRPAPPPARPRISADRLLGTRPVPQSFDQLQSILKPDAYSQSDSEYRSIPVFFGIGAFFISVAAGDSIDSLINEPIYERRPTPPRVAVAPWLGPDQKGIAVRVNF
jgi:hypothetical protein